nr:hypothetical protein [Tanacetum cinerariifolium]
LGAFGKRRFAVNAISGTVQVNHGQRIVVDDGGGDAAVGAADHDVFKVAAGDLADRDLNVFNAFRDRVVERCQVERDAAGAGRNLHADDFG